MVGGGFEPAKNTSENLRFDNSGVTSGVTILNDARGRDAGIRRKDTPTPGGWCLWREPKGDRLGVRVRLGKRAFGCAVERWFPEEATALRWIAAEQRRVVEVGRAPWVPSREQLLELEQVAALRASVAHEGLRLRTLVELVRADIREARREKQTGLVTLREAIDAWSGAKKLKSEQHVQKCTMVYERFAAPFGENKAMRSVTAQDAENWAKGLNVSENTRTRYVRRMIGLWTWAAKPQRRWVSENPWETVEVEPLSHARPGILSIEQISTLLRTAALEPGMPLVPFLTIAIFGGPRIAEARRLEWSSICLEPGEEGIRLDPEKTKTGSRRWVPLPPAAIAWLKLFPGRKEGMVAPRSWNFRRERLLARAGFTVKGVVSGKSLRRVAPDAGEAKWGWPRNALRHSYCSYAVAHLRDLAEVAFRAGNSERVLRRDYVAAVTSKEGTRYFALTPDSVLQLPT